ncbi:DUF4351 domain-containing protein [Pannus brasiliensis CCIBt3594]|uniref:DUF4351 domain-containing protein n=1 Tax=Pannus brasiliensis CCIBt3594 TaxID=1427578 RepID=A0AAW9QV74_9CHRO
MTETIDHDRLFKELLSTFFIEFIELFFPEVIAYLDPDSIVLLDKETFTDVTAGEKYETDLIARVRFRGQPSFFLVHIEAESGSRSRFDRRMFRYFARLHEKFALPVYPIVLFSYDRPKKAAIDHYSIAFPDFQVLQFNYRVVQLNRLNWRDFLNRPNPVASALMAKMNIAAIDRPRVKAECLRLLVTLRLNPAKMQLISGFVDTYLKLNRTEEQQFRQELGTLDQEEREEVMQIVTSWMQQGIEQGIERGIERGIEQGIERGIEREKALILRQLHRKIGEIDSELENRVRGLSIDRMEALAEALLDFSTAEDLRDWLENPENVE